MTVQEKMEITTLLRSRNLKVTKNRVSVLYTLKSASSPLSIESIRKQIKNACDVVTLYRMFETFVETKLARKINLEHNHPHFEFGDEDHHHVSCIHCGKVAHLEHCEVATPSSAELKTLGFSKLDHHSLEFFGVCENCLKNPKKQNKC